MRPAAGQGLWHRPGGVGIVVERQRGPAGGGEVTTGPGQFDPEPAQGLGGDLEVEVDGGGVWIEGPASYVFEGSVPVTLPTAAP